MMEMHCLAAALRNTHSLELELGVDVAMPLA